MKFLVNKFLFYFCSFFSLLFSSECISSWYQSVIKPNHNGIYKFVFDINIDINKQSISSDSIILYIDKQNSKIRLDYKNQFIIFEELQRTTLFKDTNQLFIENPNLELNNMITSFLNIDSLPNFTYLDNKYILLNSSLYDEVILNFNSDCSKIISM